MGYEVRAIIATSIENWREREIHMEGDALWVSVMADFWMRKSYTTPYREIVANARSKEARRYYFHEGRNDDILVKSDDYGNPLQRLEVPDVIDAIEESLMSQPHLGMLRALMASLRVYQELYESDELHDLFVLHYGY